MCMEDYVIWRSLQYRTTTSVAATSIVLPGDSDRVGLYVWTGVLTGAAVFFSGPAPLRKFWTATNEINSRYFSIEEFGQLMLLPITITDNGQGPELTVVETILKRQS